MATGVACPNPILQFFNNAGQPAAGGSVLTQVGGVNTATYQDFGLTTPLPNPIPLNSRGEVSDAGGISRQIFLTPNTVYTFTLSDSNGNQLNQATYVNGVQITSTQVGQMLYPQTSVETGLSITPTSYLYPAGNVLRYGADPTGVADSGTAFANARAVASGASIEMAIPGGSYKFSASLQWGFANLRVRAYGKVTLNFSQSGQCVLVDGGLGAGINDVSITGEIRVIGNASTTDAWFIRACHRSWIEGIAADSGCGFRINWCVATDFKLCCSINEAGSFPSQTPQAGLILDQRGSGETVAGCTFITPIFEGITAGNGIGIDLEHTLQNIFLGGTSEGNRIGVRQLAQTPQDNFGNTFYGMDFESNSQNDIIVTGGGSITFVGINANSVSANPNADLFGDNATFIGGFVRQVQAESASTGTALVGVQLSNGGGLGITGTGPYRAISCQLVNGARTPTAQVVDQVGNTINTFVPTISGATTPGTQTYAANGQKCTYTQVGSAGNGWVDFSIFLTLTGNSGGAGNAVISLPVTARNLTNAFQTVVIGDYTGVTLGAAGRTLAARINPNGTTATLLETDTGSK